MGHSDLAVPLYRKALDVGLSGERRRRAVIQLASSLRNVGRPEESVALLRTEMDLITWMTQSAGSSRSL
jgi:Tetratrico peptide repeat